MIALVALALAQEPQLTVETWNVGLAYGFVDYGKQRRDPILDALEESSADVVCLQEAWEKKDRRRIGRALEEAYPNQVILPVEQSRTERAPSCRGSELFGEGRFVTCLTDQCGDAEGDDKTDCIIEECGPVLEALRDENPECATSLMAQVGKSGLAAILAVRSPFRKPGVYAYHGSDGTVLLSRLPFRDTGVLDFSDVATLNRRRAPWADVAVGDETVRVYCTHLTADLSNIAPYPGTSGSWGAEQRIEIERMIAEAGAVEHPVVLTGDFNCGWDDEATGIVGELPENCDLFVDAGYESVGLDEPVCTFCGTNPIVAEDEAEHTNGRIDHVWVRGLYATDHGRVHDEPVDIGGGVVTAYSDHYGFAASLVVGEPPAAPEPDPTPGMERPQGVGPSGEDGDVPVLEDMDDAAAPVEDAPSGMTRPE